MHRPQTCPAALTPQFHWNLNARAVESLSETELTQAYQLFRFYDSSSGADALPSIHCRRLLQLLQDGGLVGGAADSPKLEEQEEIARLDSAAVEKLFAEATLGKLRTYLDADGQPVLTFQLFCDALLNCAACVFPALRAEPDAALAKLLARLLLCTDRYAAKRERAQRPTTGLLQHFPVGGLWCPDEAHRAVARMPSSGDDDDDFRRLESFQQVLATFSLDLEHERRARERSQRQYTIPPELAAHFSAEHLRLVVERFQLFDVFDRGLLPRLEILPLLTGLVKKLEIPDVYAVLAALLARPGESPDVAKHQAAEISLHDVLHALHSCRRSRTAASHSTGGAAAASRSHRHGAHAAGHTRLAAQASGAGDGRDDRSRVGVDAVAAGGGSESRKSSASASKKGGHKTSKPDAKGSASRLAAPTLSKRRSARAAPAPAPASGKEPPPHHKPSALVKDDDLESAAAAATAPASSLQRRISRRASVRPELASTSENETVESNNLVAHSSNSRSDARAKSFASSSRSLHLHQDEAAPETSLSAAEPANPQTRAVADTAGGARRSKIFRVFMLLGGDHDGSICYSVELALPQRRLEESTGVFYVNAPPDILERSHVEPSPPDTASALLALQRRVRQRLREGYVVHGAESLAQVGAALARIRERDPHYASALHASSEQSTGRERKHAPLPVHDVRSLDRAATRVRQRSTSDLAAELSDPRTNDTLRDRRRAAAAAAAAPGSAGNQHPRDAATTAAADRSCAWIHALNDAARLRASASAPSLAGSVSPAAEKPSPARLRRPRAAPPKLQPIQ